METDRQEWLEQRRKVMTASDVAAVLGLNPFRSPIQVFIDKVHPEMAEESDMQELLDWGNDVEPALARAYERKTGLTLKRPGFELAYHPKYPEIACTIDGVSLDPRKLVQFKWETRFSDKFGAPGSEEVPDAYLIQCGVEMAVWGCDLEDLATMHAGPPLLIYPLHRDKELEDTIIDRAREWFDHHIVNKIEPPIDASPAWKDYLGRKFPRPSGKMLPVDEPEKLKEILLVRELKKEIKKANETVDGLENQIKAWIGDADGLQLPDGTRIMWTAVKEAEIKAYTRKAYRKLDIREASCKKSKKSA